MSVILVTQRHDQFTAVQELRAVRAACGSVTRPLVPPLPARSAPLVAKLFFGRQALCAWSSGSLLGCSPSPVPPGLRHCVARCRQSISRINIGLATEVNFTSQVTVLGLR